MANLNSTSQVPRSPGQIIADTLREIKWTQVDLADRLNAKKQNVNGWIRGREPLSEEKLRRIAEITGKDEDAFVAEARKYAAWLSSPEGKRQAAEDHREQLLQALTIRGPHFLSQTEIREAVMAGLIQVARPEAAPPAFVAKRRHFLLCHLGDWSPDIVTALPPPDGRFTIPGNGSMTFKTQEKFLLGPASTLHFVGVIDSLRENKVRPEVDLVSEFETELRPLTVTLDNRMSIPFEIRTNEPFIMVTIHYNPFEGVED